MDRRSQLSSEFHCKKCDQKDDDSMVQCDGCDEWYHYGCAGVNSGIAEISWTCEICNPLPSTATTSSEAPPTNASNGNPLKVYQSQPQASSSPRTETCQYIKPLPSHCVAASNIYSSADSAARSLEKFGGLSIEPLAGAIPKLTLRSATSAPTQIHYSAKNIQPTTMYLSTQPPTMCTNIQPTTMYPSTQPSTNIQPSIMYTNIQTDVNVAQHPMFTKSAQQHLVHQSQTADEKQDNEKMCKLRLEKLEEEVKIQRNYLEKKYEILSQSQPNLSANLSNMCIPSAPTKTQLAARQSIPKELPHFHGDPEDWPLFISSFETTTEVAGYSNAENLIRLQACLKGKAREMVRSNLLQPVMVPEIIRTLRMCFGRPEFVIESLIEKVRKVSPLKDKLDALIDFSLCVRNVCSTMEACSMDAYMNNPLLVRELVNKLPNQYKLSWAMQPKAEGVPSIKIFSDWLYALAEAASQVVSPVTARHNGHVNTHVSNENLQRKSDCAQCKGYGHKVAQCETFQKLSLDERWDSVRALKLCRQCLNIHRRRCFVNKACGLQGCNAKHHQLLHKTATQFGSNFVVPSTHPATTGALNSHKNTRQQNDPLFRILPVRIYSDDYYVDTFAFLDEGSSVTLMDDALFKQLNLRGIDDPICLRWTGDKTRNEDSSKRATIRIANLHNNNSFTITGVHTVNSLGLPTQTVVIKELAKEFSYLAGLPIQSYVDAKPAILIGADNWHLAVPLKVREGTCRQPIATKTRLGWTLQGRCSDLLSSPYLNIHTCACNEDYNKLHDLVKEHFKLEEPPAAQLLSKEHSKAKAILETTCHKIGNRFEAGLLWRYDEVNMPNSYDTALKRMMCLNKKFSRDPTLKLIMQQQIDNLLKKGYARRLGSDELQANIERIWYLPIFVTQNPNKPAKVRLVWDAAAKTRGVSLNDFILCGPDLLTPLVDILLSFRIGQFAICGDIAEMFHQINVRNSDINAQRFLWWDEKDATDKPGVYVMRVLTFGISCAPCIAHYVRNKNADEFLHQFPRAVDSIKRHHYVDDFIDSEDTEQAALKLAETVKYIHESAGFHIRNWSSNSKVVLKHLREDCASNQAPVELSETEKILGVYWDPNKDVFKYALRFARLKRNVLTDDIIPTKRELLQVLMSIFDPLGFLSIYTITLKILLQEVWRSQIDWDENIYEGLIVKWHQWKTTLSKVSSVEIPRCYSQFLNGAEDIQLHTFADAGEYGYAAVCYLRIQSGININVSLVAAKSKVAPLKPVSIPRLELQAALTGVQLSNSIQGVPRFPRCRQIFWTDSATVLKWLCMDPRQFQQYVMYRVAAILENTNLHQWKWVPSQFNPADLATKSESKTASHIWFNGPMFLWDDEREWPHRDDFGPVNTSEIRHCMLHISKVEKDKLALNIEYFSCWRRLYRALATFILYVKRLHAKTQSLHPPITLTFEMMQTAKTILVKQAQLSEYSHEIITLKSDDLDIIRVKGRVEFLNHHDVIVLPCNHHVTFLIVKDMHEKYHHLSHEAVINDIKGKYLITKLRPLYRTVRGRCQYCKIKNAKPSTPQMAPLPSARLASFERPFSYVGIDYFGPIFAAVGRRREKRWGVIFTCLTIRAVHIEIAHSLDTSSCILCIRNFISRRGMPIEIYTDNGTNFKASAKILEETKNNVDYNAIEAKFDDIKWKFNPPAAPHMGGAWERLIRSIKAVLSTMHPDTMFNDESLRSALLEVEFIINSRPLTFVSLESCDDEAITPNHLLIGSAGGDKPMFHNGDLRHRYHQTQKYADRFWQRWIKEYTPVIARRTKWFLKQPPLNIGDVVIIADETQPRNKWPKGVVLDVVTAKDGQVRRATVKTQYGVLERPAVKIAVLDVGKPQE